MPPATSSAQALGNLQSAQSQAQTPDQIMQSTDQQLGVGAAQGQVSGLRQAITNTTNLLNGVAPSVEGRTQNSLVTDAQAGKQIQNESAPIQATLTGQNTALSNDQSDLSSLLSQASTEAGLKAQGQSDKLTNLESIYKDLYGQEQDAAAAAEKQAQDAEAKRQFDATMAETQANDAANRQATAANTAVKSSASAAKASTPSTAQQRQTDTANTFQNLYSLQGKDTHVSPSTWSQALAQWNKEGYSTPDFVKTFQQFVNPHMPSGSYTGFTGYS